MLVLSRKKNESIMIGDNIEVKILSVDGDQVKVGIIAPKKIKVHRAEIYEAIQKQNEESLSVTNPLLLLNQLKK